LISPVKWTVPSPLKAEHGFSAFTCGEISLDHWLKQRALRNEGRGASRTYVVCVDHPRAETVVAYYCLATGSIACELAPGGIRRNMPDPIPVMVLSRLAVDVNWQGQGIGKALLRDAIMRTIQVSEIVGVKALVVHAHSEQAVKFSEEHGFQQSPMDFYTLLLPLSRVI
jgi:GNAT superfamily N-acetyltransferase